jgi:hypothetical protein
METGSELESSRDLVMSWDLQELIAAFSGNGGISCSTISACGDVIVAGDRLGAVHFLRPMALPKAKQDMLPFGARRNGVDDAAGAKAAGTQ